MKKIYFAIAACAIFAFAACNNSTGTDGKDTAKSDTTAAMPEESTNTMSADTTAKMDTAAKTEAAPAAEKK